MRPRPRFLSLITISCLLLTVGCGGSDKPADPAGSTESAAAPPAAPERSAPPAAGVQTQGEKPANPQPQIRITRAAAPEGTFDTVDRYTEQFFTGELSELHANFSDEMQQSFTLDQLTQMRAHVAATYGKQSKELARDHSVRDEYRGYVRWAEFDKHDGVIEIQWILRQDDSIAGFFVQPAKTKSGDS